MKYYCIGIKGAGMSTLAQILYDLGNEVSGYDETIDYKFTEKGLHERNIKIYNDSNHPLDKDTIVTYSVAFPLSHKEMQRVQKLGLTIKKYNEIIGEITSMFNTICISGTHGKTSTSSMVKHLLTGTYNPSYFIGSGNGYISKDSNIFVIESDEFNRHFLTYHPTNTIITNMEEEHMECYKDLNDIIDTFNKFASNTKEKIIACGDNINTHKLKLKQDIVYYGFNNDNEYIIKNNIVTDGEEFDLYHHNDFIEHFKLPIFGTHMVLNATAAIIMAINYNVSINDIKNRLSTFKNEDRRFAETFIKDTIIIDDYAHHPTEINATITAIKRKYPAKRLVVVFKPNTYSRIKDFQDDFIKSLSNCDQVYLTNVDSNREKQSDYPNINSYLITDHIPNAAIISEDNMDILKKEKGSVVAFLSCASVSHLIENFTKLIEEDSK